MVNTLWWDLLRKFWKRLEKMFFQAPTAGLGIYIASVYSQNGGLEKRSTMYSGF